MMNLNKVMEDLLNLDRSGFTDCNIKCLLGKLEEVTESIVVDKFIADWYEKNKEDFEYKLWEWFNYKSAEGKRKNEQFYMWLNNCINNPVETLVKMKLFGYKVKYEIKYRVKVLETCQILYKGDFGVEFVNTFGTKKQKNYEFTKEELNNYGMSYVFNNKGFKVEEVEG